MKCTPKREFFSLFLSFSRRDFPNFFVFHFCRRHLDVLFILTNEVNTTYCVLLRPEALYIVPYRYVIRNVCIIEYYSVVIIIEMPYAQHKINPLKSYWKQSEWQSTEESDNSTPTGSEAGKQWRRRATTSTNNNDSTLYYCYRRVGMCLLCSLLY